MKNCDFPMEIISASSNAGGATEPSPKIVAVAEERGMMAFGRGKCGGNGTPKDFLEILPSGKHTKNYGKSQFLMGQSTISMVIFNSCSYFDITRG